MDPSPFDIETLAKIASDLFRDGAPPAPGPTEVPSVVQAAAPAVNPGPRDQSLEASAPHGFGVPRGGATFAPQAPPTRPAFGRPVSTEAPVVGYGSGQPAIGTVPAFEASRSAFDPRFLPGFAPIPNVEDGFADLGTLGLIPRDMSAGLPIPGLPTSGLPIPDLSAPDLPTNGLPSAGVPLAGVPSPSFGDVPSAAQAVPGVGFDEMTTGPAVPTAGGGAFSPTAPATQPAFGRPLSAEPPFVGYGTGQPKLGHGVPGEHLFPQTASLDPVSLERGASYLAPTDMPGLAAAPVAPASYGGSSAPAVAPQRTGSRSIDRPTPNAFEFADAPHLGEFAEESILRTALDPKTGAPSIEGLRDRPSSPPDPYHSQLVPSAAPSFYFLDDRMDYFADDVPDVPRPTATPFNAEAVRRDFPALHQTVNGHPLVWLDNGATTQKPQAVIDRIARFYEKDYSNISRSAHELAVRATNAYEDARKTVQRFVNASEFEEIVFVRGTTEAINLVAQSFGRRFIKEGDEILLTHGEHHANIVPWYNLAKEVGAHLKVVPFDDNGDIMLDEYEQLLNHRVKIVATTHVANALGTILPVKAMTEMAHRHGIPILVDGAQSISHMPIDVQDIDCDFYVFSGHKVFAPTGIGALYGKKALLDQMPPWQGGGNMIKDVTFERITFQPPPLRFEAGTGSIVDAIGLAEALKYLERLGMTNIEDYEHVLLDYATQKLAPIPGLKIIGKSKAKAGVISFVLDGKEPAEVGKALNEKGIAVRAGHHCALPILRRYGVEATVRPAFALYNTFDDADRLAEAVREIAAN